jgi:16S rRNA (guanine527-N7)-methyltransferase
METLIRQGLAQLGLDCEKAPALAQYGQMLLEKNQVMNLTAITDPHQVARLHMLDCAALLGYADLNGKTLIDVGTGAGFPGMVLKIMEPSLELTLLDSLEKRLNWLAEVCDALGLTGVRFVHARAEEQALDPTFREQFDFATARAVASMNTLSEICLPYVKVGGHFLAMKSVDSSEEINQASSAISKLGGRLEKRYDYTIPGTEISHRIIPVLKLSPTPTNYPRRWAKIQKNPL